MKKPRIDMDYLQERLLRLLEIPSPTGYTDAIVQDVGEELQRLEIPFELSRRGAIRADLKGGGESPGRALLTHLDTVGAMVRSILPDGRLRVAPVGTWPARSAEGARVTIFTDGEPCAGTLLPAKASGHVFAEAVDAQAASWETLELRLDEDVSRAEDAGRLGIEVGDFVAVDPVPRIVNGFVNARHLDDKAGVACVLAAAKAVRDEGLKLAEGCRLLFTISEEVGSGASTILHGSISELVALDNATLGPGQNSSDRGVTVAMMDSSGPFDWHLTRRLLQLCSEHRVSHRRDVYRHYRCDAASAVEAGNDLRTALIGFGLDASHGYERVHLDSLKATAELVALYIQAPLVVPTDTRPLGPLKRLTHQPTGDVRFRPREVS